MSLNLTKNTMVTHKWYGKVKYGKLVLNTMSCVTPKCFKEQQRITMVCPQCSNMVMSWYFFVNLLVCMNKQYHNASLRSEEHALGDSRGFTMVFVPMDRRHLMGFHSSRDGQCLPNTQINNPRGRRTPNDGTSTLLLCHKTRWKQFGANTISNNLS